MGKGLECGHYCHPSAPQLWLFSLFRTMQALVKPLDKNVTTVRLSVRLRRHSTTVLRGL